MEFHSSFNSPRVNKSSEEDVSSALTDHLHLVPATNHKRPLQTLQVHFQTNLRLLHNLFQHHHHSSQSNNVPKGQSKNLAGFLIKRIFAGRPSPAGLMISCFGGGGAPPVTNNVVVGDLDQHLELHKEAVKASGITIAVGVVILFLACWYYHYQRAMRDSAVVRAHRAQRRNPFNFANPFVAPQAMQMAPIPAAQPAVHIPSAPPMYSHPQ